MSPYLAAIGAGLIAATGAWLGHLCSRLRKPYWLAGYVLPLLVILVCALAAQNAAIALAPPLSWLALGRRKFAVAGFAAAMVLTTPLSRLPRKRDRFVVALLTVVIVVTGSVWPFLAPAFARHQFELLQTRIDADGVCRQTTDYTCGPASAVTALRKLGLPAEEGKIALLSGTSAGTGTCPDILAAALQDFYGRDGLIAEYRAFHDIADLKKAGLTLAVVKFSFLVDHYVTVLEVTDSGVVVGDPLAGRDVLSYNEFKQRWRYTGVVLRRTSQ